MKAALLMKVLCGGVKSRFRSSFIATPDLEALLESVWSPRFATMVHNVFARSVQRGSALCDAHSALFECQTSADSSSGKREKSSDDVSEKLGMALVELIILIIILYVMHPFISDKLRTLLILNTDNTSDTGNPNIYISIWQSRSVGFVAFRFT